MLIVANWKMNKNINETLFFINKVAENFENIKNFIKNNVAILCMPFICIDAAIKQVKNKNLCNFFVGAQNCYFEKEGAFTGEISAHMLKDIGVKYVILGHSERRCLFNETDEFINKKVLSCLSEGLNVILCVGENLEQKNKGLTNKILSNQISAALMGISKGNLTRIAIAYEPVWAIGAKKSASCSEIDDIVGYIKKEVSGLFGIDENLDSKLKVLYGGSVNPENAYEILKVKHLDGVLVGNASLNYESFLKILCCV